MKSSKEEFDFIVVEDRKTSLNAQIQEDIKVNKESIEENFDILEEEEANEASDQVNKFGPGCKCNSNKNSSWGCCDTFINWIKILEGKWNIKFDNNEALIKFKLNRATKCKKDDSIQIAKDIIRTFPENKYFSRNKRGSGLNKLSILLKTWANYQSKTGYIQGLNFIFAVLLYHSEEYLAFWLFDTIFIKYNLDDIFSPTMVGVQKHLLLIEKIYLLNFHFLSNSLEKCGISLPSLMCSWIITLFLNSTEIEDADQIFTNFLIHGWIFIYKLMFTSVKDMEKKMQKTNKVPDKIDLKDFCTDKPLHSFFKKNFNIFGVFKMNKKLKNLLAKAQNVLMDEKYISELLSNYDYENRKFKIQLEEERLKIYFPSKEFNLPDN